MLIQDERDNTLLPHTIGFAQPDTGPSGTILTHVRSLSLNVHRVERDVDISISEYDLTISYVYVLRVFYFISFRGWRAASSLSMLRE